jgi:hypothetical protein
MHVAAHDSAIGADAETRKVEFKTNKLKLRIDKNP